MSSIKKYIFILIISLQTVPLFATDHAAAFFGIKPDGSTLNTRSIQFAIDHISASGGGRLVFAVGKYLTGTVYLKSNVTLHIEEGAVLVGSLNPFDYDRKGFTALLFAFDQHNIGITGKGTIDGQGKYLARNVVNIIEKGLIEDSYKYGRPSAENRAMLVYFRSCNNVVVRGVTFLNAACWTQTYDQCKILVIDSIKVDCTNYWNEDGVDIVDCEDVQMTNSYIDAADDGICLKSHDRSKACKNILISNNIIRSSANGIKFGTASNGGFEDVRILNNIVFDTYRSAIALEAVDGGYLRNIVIDGLQSKNTGNLLFLRVGERVAGKKSSMQNIQVSNCTADIPAKKPDAGYIYEGPEEDQPRNISPAIIIMGLPDALIKDVTVRNLVFTHAGGAKIHYANIPLDKLNTIPELPANYPDFSMFKELPSWGIFARHATGLQFENITMLSQRKDFRMPVVLDDVRNASFKGIHLNPGEKQNLLYQNNCKEITVKN